jgi:hypothetical protein
MMIIDVIKYDVGILGELEMVDALNMRSFLFRFCPDLSSNHPWSIYLFINNAICRGDFNIN